MNRQLSTQNKKSRRTKLSGLEDSKDFVPAIQEIASLAAVSAIREAKVLKIPLTYLKGNEIVRKFSDGRTETISHLVKKKKSVILKKGTVLHARSK